jgi:type II secretory pathway component PulF
MYLLLNLVLGLMWDVPFGRARAAQQATLLWTLSAAVDRHIPLVPFLEALSEEAGGRWRYKLRGLADLLNSGVSIPDALEAVSNILPEDTLVTIRVGAESGQLGPALRDAASQFSRRSDAPRAVAGSSIVYFCALGFAMLNIVAFVMYWIIPKFKSIFDGFDIDLPELTVTLIRSANFAVNYFYLIFPATIIAILASAAVAIEFMQLAQGMGSSSTLSRWFPQFRTPTLLRSLGLAVDGARSFHETLELLLIRHPSLSIRRRLSSVEQAVSQGYGCWESLHSAGFLGRRDAALLATAERVGNLSWALRGVADSIERRTAQRARVIAEFIRPIALLIAGAIVGVFVVGMFIPVVKVILEMPIERGPL